MCVDVFIHISTYACMCTCVYVYVCMCACVRTFSCMCVYVCIRVHVCMLRIYVEVIQVAKVGAASQYT